MSSNQKHTASGGPQTQRFSTSPYQPITQTGSRADFQVSTSANTYVPQPPNQGGNQGPGLRGITPTVPPNQASTPPNADIKVQTLQQPQSMGQIFVPQGRSGQGTFYAARTPGPTAQTQRMQNHSNRPPAPMYGAQAQYVQIQPIYLPNSPYYSQRPQGFVQSSIPMYTGQHLTYPYNPQPAQAPSVNFFYNQQLLQRTGPLQPAQPAAPNPTQPAIPNVPLVPNAPQQQHFSRQQNRRRSNAIPIIDPTTGADRLNEIFEANSHPPSGESSARQTPQPSTHSHNKEVQATFAKLVLQTLNKDVEQLHIDDSDHQDSPGDHIDHASYSPPQSLAVNQNRLDHLVQSSTLKVQAKEFVLSNTAKETPIVSANCDAVEVTLPNKPPKDRESPVKGRKQRDPSVREMKDSVKEPSPVKEENSDNRTFIGQDVEVKQRDESPPRLATNVPQTIATSKDGSIENLVVDQKSQKKDVGETKRIETKVPVDQSECASSTPASNQPAPPGQDSSAGKSKQNAQRTAQKQAAPQNNNQKPAQASVPPPQPAKANNKTHKKNEINQKGANKEGTDMDAFNDNMVDKEEVNANITTNSNDIINANSVSIANNTPTTVTVEPSKKQNDSNEITTIKSEPLKTLKTKVDITDIVKDKPKPIKPFTVATESQDEPDRVAISTDKLVQAKNEANAKANSENGNERPTLPYRKGQWSPNDPNGDKVYFKDFLMAVRELPLSRRKPDNIPDVVFMDERERARLSDTRPSLGGSRTDFTTPPFNSYGGGKSGSQRGVLPKRNSQTKMGGSGLKASKQGVKVTLSLREDVKLHETENAWRPARLNKGDFVTEDDKKTEELYKKVRGVLNKLTPQKFDTLLSQIKSLQIDTAERLQGVIDLVFEKAVDEPNFSVAYALMCKELATLQVLTAHSTKENPEYVNFRKLIITRCQMEFEKQSVDESVRNEKVKEIDACPDPEKKKDLQFELEEHDRRLRMKSVGNIRFIGELFKKGMLTVNIMNRCLTNLLDHKDEESLECLCKLLTTIGKELEGKGVDLSPIFTSMKNITDKKEGRVSSRIRFMLQDVIDLRNSKWVPRRQDLNPKTIDQIQKEADNEQINIHMMNSVPMTPRKDDRSGPGSIDRKGRGRNVTDDGWIVNSRNRNTQITVQSDKLKIKAPLVDEPFGSSQTFGNWSKGSIGVNVKTPPQVLANTANKYSALEIMETEKRPISSRPGSKEPYSSKGTSLERGYGKLYDGRGSRSGSQHRSNDSSASSSQRSTPAPVMPPAQPKPVQQAPVVQLTEEQIIRRINNSLDEYITGSCTADDYFLDISSILPPSYYPRIVSDSYSRVLEKSQQARLKTGGLFAKLIKSGKIPLEDYCTGLEEIFLQAEDLQIDVPKIWDYLAEILVNLVCEEVLPLSRLYKSFQPLIKQDRAVEVLVPLFKFVVTEVGPNFLQNIWQVSGLQLTDFMPASQIKSFIEDNQFGFLLGRGTPVGQNHLTYEQIQNKLSEFLKLSSPIDSIVNWITANIGDKVKENKFIRALATAVFESSINKNFKLVPETLAAHSTLLLKYVDNKSDYELQCLYALQALIHKMEHPPGLLLAICDKLYEVGSFSQESFLAWENSNDPAEQEGKGVALKQLTSLFTQMKENDEEDYGSSTSEDA